MNIKHRTCAVYTFNLISGFHLFYKNINNTCANCIHVAFLCYSLMCTTRTSYIVTTNKLPKNYCKAPAWSHSYSYPHFYFLLYFPFPVFPLFLIPHSVILLLYFSIFLIPILFHFKNSLLFTLLPILLILFITSLRYSIPYSLLSINIIDHFS